MDAGEPEFLHSAALDTYLALAHLRDPVWQELVTLLVDGQSMSDVFAILQSLGELVLGQSIGQAFNADFGHSVEETNKVDFGHDEGGAPELLGQRMGHVALGGDVGFPSFGDALTHAGVQADKNQQKSVSFEFEVSGG